MSSRASSTARTAEFASPPSTRNLTMAERNTNLRGPSVSITVGPKKKIYTLPQATICYFSTFFEEHFKNTKKLELLDESVEEFDVLVEYMMRGTIPGEKNSTLKRNIEGNKNTIATCLRFLKSAHKFDLGDVSEVIYGPLSKALWDLAHHKRRMDTCNGPRLSKMEQQLQCGIESKDIELVFNICPKAKKLKILVAQAALSFSGPQGIQTWSEPTENVPGFATEFMGQLAASFQRQRWVDPITKQKRQ